MTIIQSITKSTKLGTFCALKCLVCLSTTVCTQQRERESIRKVHFESTFRGYFAVAKTCNKGKYLFPFPLKDVVAFKCYFFFFFTFGSDVQGVPHRLVQNQTSAVVMFLSLVAFLHSQFYSKYAFGITIFYTEMTRKFDFWSF